MDDLARGHARIGEAAREAVAPIAGLGDAEAAAIAAAFTLTSSDAILPDATPPDARAGLAVIEVDDLPRGFSRKFGNLFLSWRKLFEILPDIALAASAAAGGQPWLVVAAALYVWNRLRNGATERFSDAEALVLYALWQAAGRGGRIGYDDGLAATARTAARFGAARLSASAFARAIDTLLRIGCVRLWDGEIFLVEDVRIAG